MVDDRWVPLRIAWEEALYGAEGFYRRHQPADHFRTSAHASAAFADAVVELARRRGLTSVCDLGAGRGELLTQIHAREPTWTLLAVEIRGRPSELAETIGWQERFPSGWGGLVFAHELLDNVTCDVVELDDAGAQRLVEVDRETGGERLGEPVSPEQLAWLSTWWPMPVGGDRAEVGLARETFWTRVCTANPGALCIAVDYGHTVADRPVGGSLTSYRDGVQTPVTYDGLHDITAHVALDSLASAVGGTVRRQRDVLAELGLSPRRPALGRASDDPAGYLRDLSRATEIAELVAVGGLGEFGWVFSSET